MEKEPHSKEQLLALLREEGESFAGWLDTLSDEFLGERVSMPLRPGGPRLDTEKSRFEMLLAPKEHELHHRAQLMVIERILGMTPHLTRHMHARMEKMKAEA